MNSKVESIRFWAVDQTNSEVITKGPRFPTMSPSDEHDAHRQNPSIHECYHSFIETLNRDKTIDSGGKVDGVEV